MPTNTGERTTQEARSPSPLSAMSRTTSNRSASHADVSDEVAALSAKLVDSLNHQTNIDDSLQTARHELEEAKEKIAKLEAAAEEHERLISQGLLVKKADVEAIQKKLRGEINVERDTKVAVEKQKKRIELELETLTQSLFEEANGMVAQARKQQEVSERKTDQLRHQLNDAELLLASHQEQLHDLKGRMEQLQDERDQAESALPSTAPGTPMNMPHDKGAQAIEPHPDFQIEPALTTIPPDQPLYFSNLIHPVLRYDLYVFEEFVSLLKTSKNPPSSRAQSGTFGGLNVMGLTSLGSSKESKEVKQSPQATAVSSSSLSSSSPGSPTPPGESTQEAAAALASLKEAKFYKRALTEDIEPTLRLDLAPGLSWLARRTVLNSMTIGSLVVEPFPQTSRVYGAAFACTMCGEVRRTEKYARRHRFRASEADDAQRYPLCDYCVARVRSSCDYIGFLRMVKNGHWRSDTEEEQNTAWDESVRLRERMFWARIGGGVVPAASYIAPTSLTLSKAGNSAPGTPRPMSLKQPPTSNPTQSDDKAASEDPVDGSDQTVKSTSNGDQAEEAENEETADQIHNEMTADEARIQAETAEQLRSNVQAAIALKRGSRGDITPPPPAEDESQSPAG